MFYTSEGEASLQSLAGQALDAAAAGIVTFVERRWGNARQFAHVLFAGGGAEALLPPKKTKRLVHVRRQFART